MSASLIKTRVTRSIAALAVMGAMTFGTALSAEAVNQGTRDGNQTTACAVSWRAESGMDQRREPYMPSDLLVDLDGNSVDYSNGGYVYAVSPELNNGPGIFEVQHWIGKDANGVDKMFWRYYIATDRPMKDVKVRLLPMPGFSYTWVDSTEWAGTSYASATGLPYTVQTPPKSVELDSSDLVQPTGMVTIGDLPANGVTSFTLINEGTLNNADGITVSAYGRLTGTYTDNCATDPGDPDDPGPKPAIPAATYTNWKTVRAATCTATGSQTRTKTSYNWVVKEGKWVKTSSNSTETRALAKLACVTRTFQVDRYMPRTNARARVVASLDNDRRLKYREDKALWRDSRWQIVSVQVPKGASWSTVAKAINAKTSSRVGDIKTNKQLSTARRGGTYVMAWEIGKTSWALGKSSKYRAPQYYIGRS